MSIKKQSSPVSRRTPVISGTYAKCSRQVVIRAWVVRGRTTAWMFRPSRAGSIVARYPVMTPACSSRLIRADTAGCDRLTRRPISVTPTCPRTAGWPGSRGQSNPMNPTVVPHIWNTLTCAIGQVLDDRCWI
jgi:hypothetical protein